MKYIKDENCTVVYYSQVGSNHIKAGKENQDTVFFERLDKNRWYIAIADGVSSAAKSKQGSQSAVEVAHEICLMLKNEEWNLEDIKVDIVRKWKSKFSKDWNDYATTLNLLAYVDGKLLVGQIGDGLMVTNVDGEDEIYTEESDFYSTETDALAEAVRRKAITLTQKHISKKFYAYLISTKFHRTFNPSLNARNLYSSWCNFPLRCCLFDRHISVHMHLNYDNSRHYFQKRA